MDSYQRILRISVSGIPKERKRILIDYKDIACSAAYLMACWDHCRGFKRHQFFHIWNIDLHAWHNERCWQYEVLGVRRNDSLVQRVTIVNGGSFIAQNFFFDTKSHSRVMMCTEKNYITSAFITNYCQPSTLIVLLVLIINLSSKYKKIKTTTTTQPQIKIRS
jgi:hypothetical protein